LLLGKEDGGDLLWQHGYRRAAEVLTEKVEALRSYPLSSSHRLHSSAVW
jgi:hypothetical protein